MHGRFWEHCCKFAQEPRDIHKVTERLGKYRQQHGAGFNSRKSLQLREQRSVEIDNCVGDKLTWFKSLSFNGFSNDNFQVCHGFMIHIPGLLKL